MEMVCYRLWKWKGTVWATAYGNGRGLFGQPVKQPFMEMEEDCLASTYSNNVLLFVILSYKIWQWCLTEYGNDVLQNMVIMSYRL